MNKQKNPYKTKSNINYAYQILQFKLKSSTEVQCKLPVLKLTAYYIFPKAM